MLCWIALPLVSSSSHPVGRNKPPTEISSGPSLFELGAGCTTMIEFTLATSPPQTLKMSCKPIQPYAVLLFAFLCKHCKKSPTVISQFIPILTGTVENVGPEIFSMPGTGQFRPFRVAPNRTFVLSVCFHSTIAHAAHKYVDFRISGEKDEIVGSCD
jgi:hypothetical protein